MAVQLISYDLRKPGQDYEGLYEAIKKIGSWMHCLGSVWLVRTALSSSQVRDVLTAHIDVNDSLIVTGLSGGWATLGLSKIGTEWLADNLQR